MNSFQAFLLSCSACNPSPARSASVRRKSFWPLRPNEQGERRFKSLPDLHESFIGLLPYARRLHRILEDPQKESAGVAVARAAEQEPNVGDGDLPDEFVRVALGHRLE